MTVFVWLSTYSSYGVAGLLLVLLFGGPVVLFADLLIAHAQQKLSCGLLLTSICTVLLTCAFLPLLVFE